MKDFVSSVPMAKPEPDCITKSLSSSRLTSPHSAALIDIDGDCMSDLFLTVEEISSGRKFYEIWLRRETQTTLDLTKEAPTANASKVNKTSAEEDFPANTLTGLQSFCLVTREEIP